MKKIIPILGFISIFVIGGAIIILGIVFSAVFSDKITITTIDREPIIIGDISAEEIKDFTVFLDDSGIYEIWIDCNLEYNTGFKPVIAVSIIGDEVEINRRYDPLNTRLTMKKAESNIFGVVKTRFKGRLDRINLKAGEYRISAESIFDDNLIQVNKYELYIE